MHEYVVLPKSVKKERISENINIGTFAINQEDLNQMDNLDEHLVTGNAPVMASYFQQWTLIFYRLGPYYMRVRTFHPL